MVLFNHEMKMNLKSLIIWTICVGGMCFGCILLYSSMEGALDDISDVYSNLGAMSTAMGLDKLSLATLVGFYATEITMMHGLGGAMFAAIIGSGILSKEESGHTSEFLNAFPISRIKIAGSKFLAIVSNIAIFNLVCIGLYILGFVVLKEDIPIKEMVLYHSSQIMMQVEIGTICFMISSFSRKNLIGAGLGVAILAFAADMMCRIIPAIENVKYITPFYYSNAADIFTNKEVDAGMIAIGIGITISALIVALIKYNKKDLAA